MELFQKALLVSKSKPATKSNDTNTERPKKAQKSPMKLDRAKSRYVWTQLLYVKI